MSVPASHQSHIVLGSFSRRPPDPGSRLAEFIVAGLNREWPVSVVDIIDVCDAICAHAHRDPMILRMFVENGLNKVAGLQRREISHSEPPDPRSLRIIDEVMAQALATPPTIANISFGCVDVFLQWLATEWTAQRKGLSNLAFWVVAPPYTSVDGEFSCSIDFIKAIRAKLPESRIIVMGDFLACDSIELEIRRLEIQPVERLETTMATVLQSSPDTQLTIEQIMSMAGWAESVIADVARLLRTHAMATSAPTREAGSVVQLQRPSTAPPRPRADPENPRPAGKLEDTQIRPRQAT